MSAMLPSAAIPALSTTPSTITAAGSTVSDATPVTSAPTGRGQFYAYIQKNTSRHLAEWCNAQWQR